jgi:hypothetical protein
VSEAGAASGGTAANALARLPSGAFRRQDESPDTAFYRPPRLVTHIDDRAIAAVTELYRELFPPGGAILDLMSSWVSHLPPEIAYAEVVGHGMNAAELAANPRLSRFFVQDLNRETSLPLPSAAFDGAGLCVSVQYLTDPVPVLREVARALKPGAPVAITYSNRCFPTKAVAIWQALTPADQARLVLLYLEAAGLGRSEVRELLPPRGGDPLTAVIGWAA